MAKPKADSQENSTGDQRLDTGHRAGFIIPHTQLGLERIAFFSDAVFAIAITLLALELALPDENLSSSELTSLLLALTPRFLSFFLSFFVIGMFWVSHHRIFEYIETYNSGLIWINLIFLFMVAFFPFPTAVLGRYPAQFTSVAFYASAVICLALVRVWFWWYVYYRAKLIRPATDPRASRYELTRPVGTIIVFGISILIAYWRPGLAMFSWIVLLPIYLLPLFSV